MADITKYRETQYISKNKELQRLFAELESGVAVDDEVYTLIRGNHFAEFDAYIRAHPGSKEFYRILQQIFLLEYFLETPITRKQVQNALGIQQARWAVDPENCQKNIRGGNSYMVDDVKFHYFETLPEEMQRVIVYTLHNDIKRALHEEETITKEDLPAILRHTIWYGVITTPQREGSLGSWAGFKNRALKWSEINDIKDPISYYPLPESLQPLSRHYCLYVPELVFGLLSSPALTKHIILHQKRPYNAHLPSTSSNLCNVHGNTHHLLQIWFHDYSHSSSSLCSSAYTSFARSMLGDVTEETIQAMLMDPTSELSKIIELEKENEKQKKYTFFTPLNDTAVVWTRRPPSFEGQLKRKKRTKKHRGQPKTRGTRMSRRFVK